MRKSKIVFISWLLVAPIINGKTTVKEINKSYGQSAASIKTIDLYISERISSIRNDNADKYAWNPIKAVAEGGKIFILDRSWYSVLVFTEKGKYLDAFGTKGQGPAEFNIPVDIEICGGKIYILDNGNYAVKIFDLNGKYVFSFKTYKSYRRIVVNPKSKLLFLAPIIVNKESKIIDVFDEKGEYLRSFGEPIVEGDRGINAANMANISYMKDDKIVVSYDSFRVVRVFEENGKEIAKFKIEDERMIENEKYNKGYYDRTSKQSTCKTVTYGMYVKEKNIYILQAYPRMKIFMFDENGNCQGIYLGDKNEKSGVAGFYVKKVNDVREFHVLCRDPEIEINIFRPRDIN